MLWRHPNPTSTQTYLFKKAVEEKHGIALEDYEALRQWSITHLNQFWEDVWHWTSVKASHPFTKVDTKTLISDNF